VRVAYVECRSGVAGDMLLGALIDSGAAVDEIRAGLDALDLPGWELAVSETHRAGIRATRVEVLIDDDETERSYADVKLLIQNASLAPPVARRALETFAVLAKAEAKVHGIDRDDVHFHEVGAHDAVIDIVGCSVAFEAIAADRIVSSPLPTGSGTVETRHGVLPVPAPAVMEILRGAPVYGAGTTELVTPTGAALLVANSDSFGAMPPMRIDSIGYGAGARDNSEIANVTRVFLGEAIPATDGARTHVVIETNVDDMSPELIPHALEQLLAAGADDAWVTPIVMKKGRPAFTLSALCTEADQDRVLDALFRETTTFGARVQAAGKVALTREWIEVEVAGMPVRVKLARRAGEVIGAAPEHDDALKVARATGMALKDVYSAALLALDRVGSS
jgi:uncharacterized protein (TIGR00299 family) protein